MIGYNDWLYLCINMETTLDVEIFDATNPKTYLIVVGLETHTSFGWKHGKVNQMENGHQVGLGILN